MSFFNPRLYCISPNCFVFPLFCFNKETIQSQTDFHMHVDFTRREPLFNENFLSTGLNIKSSLKFLLKMLSTVLLKNFTH